MPNDINRRTKVLFEDHSVEGIEIRAFKKPQDGLICLQLIETETQNGITIRMNPTRSANQFEQGMQRMMGLCQTSVFSDFVKRFGKHEA